MNVSRCSRGLGLLLLCASGSVFAQELGILGGFAGERVFGNSTYTWQLDYRQHLARNIAASVSYINEGHVPGHHRDGNAGQLWASLPLGSRFSLSAGAGAYFFYDTQSLPNGDSADIHGTSPIFSFGATGYFSDRWFYRLLVNRIKPTHDIPLNTAAVGVGYWFGQEQRPTPGKLGDDHAEEAYVSGSEWTVFGGQTIVNTLFSETAEAYAVEFRRGWDRHIDWTASFIYEGDPAIVRRSGVAAQAWVVNSFFDEKFTLGIGLGPYVFVDRKHPRGGNPSNPAAVAPLVSITLTKRLSDHWILRFVGNRVTTTYNRDADVILIGLGYRWPR